MSWLKDLRFGVRNLVKQPLFSLTIILTLAVGIGANTAVFSMIDALILRPFPIPDIDRIVQIFETVPARSIDRSNVAPGNFLDWAKQSQSFEQLVANSWLDANLTGKDEPVRIYGRRVTPGFLDVLGVKMALGRGLLPSDRDPSQERTVVLSHQLWQDRFGSDPDILGKTITLNELDYEVVGVAEKEFSYPYGSELWIPFAFEPDDRQNRKSNYLDVLGKLRKGITPEMAQREVETISNRLAREYPITNGGRGVNVMELKWAVVDLGVPAFLAVWQATTVFVLLLACVNVANLLMVRGADRQKELTLRLALGAGRLRLVKQLLVENLMLSLAGAAAALPLSWLALKALRDSLPAHIRRFVVGWDQIDLDLRLLGVTTLIALVTAVVFGLLPALASSRVNLAGILNEAGRGGSDGKARQMGRTILVTAEVAIALMLLVASGLSIQGTFRMISADQGYDPDGVMTMQVQLPPSYDPPERRLQFFNTVLAGLGQLPGVLDAATSNVLPSSGGGSSRLVILEGEEFVNESELPRVDYRVVSNDYLKTMGIPLRSGRQLDDRDTQDSQRVAVISEVMAQRLWPGREPIGRRFRFSLAGESPWVNVVGVSGDVIQDWFFGGPRPTAYIPQSQAPGSSASLVVRAATATPEEIVPAARRVVLDVDPHIPLFEPRSMNGLLSDRLIGLRYAAIFMGIFGLIALLLAAIGIYGLVAYSVGRRTREIGVRMALGAAGRDILELTLKRTLVMMAVGSVVGLILAWGAGKFMESTLFGTISLSLSTFAIFTAILLAVALVAAFIPARQAMRIAPATALRVE